MRFLFLCLGIFSLTLSQAADAAELSFDHYKPVNLVTLTEFSSHFANIDLKNDAVFAEYLKIVNCPTYIQLKDSPFKLRETKEAVLQQRAQNKQEVKGPTFVLPTTMVVTGYNFDTQSLDILAENQMINVSNMALYSEMPTVCNERFRDIKLMPTSFRVKLSSPISLRRIPLQRHAAESLFKNLDKTVSNEQNRLIYGNLYLRIDAIQPSVFNHEERAYSTVYGQIDAIRLYVDQDRKIMFRQLTFDDGF